MGAHTALPVLGVEVESLAKDWGPQPARSSRPGHGREQIRRQRVREARQQAYIVDITDERGRSASRTSTCPRRRAATARAAGVSARTRRTRPCRRCTRSAIVFMSWFNAGVRAVDIRDPYRPKEIGYTFPAITRPDDSALRQARRKPAMQDRDPDEQRGSRQPRLHLHRRSGGHRHAHTGADGGGAGGCRLQVEKLQYDGTKPRTVKSRTARHRCRS